MKPDPARVAARWLREAGLLEAPPKLVHAVAEWTIEQACAHLMRSDVPGLPELARKHASRSPRAMAVFHLGSHLKGWRYLRLADRYRAPGQTGSNEEVLLEAIPNLSQMLEVRLDFRKGSTNGAAGTFRRPVYLTIYPANIEPEWSTYQLNRQFRTFLQDLSDTVEHELIHYTQDILRKLSENAEAGLPSTRTPDRDQGRDRDYSEEGSAAHRLHALDDVEFYSRLKDEVREFLRKISELPDTVEGHDFWVRARKMFVSDPSTAREGEIGGTLIDGGRTPTIEPSFFFTVLREDAPAKWRKAVGEFLKATQRSAPKATRAPSLPGSSRDHSYKGTDPATHDMLTRPERYLQKEIDKFLDRWSQAVESYREYAPQQEERNRKRVERGRKPRKIQTPAEGWDPARLTWTAQPAESVVLGVLSFSPSPFFETLKAYAPAKWKQAAEEFLRRTKSAKPARVAVRWLRASLCDEKVSAAWVSPAGRLHNVLDSHGEWAIRYIEDRGLEDEIDYDPDNDSFSYLENAWEEAISYLLDGGWVRVVNWKEIEAWHTKPKAMETTAKVVMDCTLELGTIDPERTTVFLWKRHSRKQVNTVADFVTKWGGRRMADELFEHLLEV